MRSRTKSLLACLIGVALAVPAIAQSGSVTQYPACPDPPPKLSPAEVDAAKASYHVGVEAYDNGDYRKALDNIKDSFRRDCSKVALLEQLALIYAALGDRQEAIHALETYLQRNPKAADAETVQNRIQNLHALMQQAASSSATSTASVTSTAATGTVTAPPTATVTAVPTSTAPPEEVHGHTAGPWIVAGVGAAAIIPGVVLLVVGHGKVSDARANCAGYGGTNMCSPTDPLGESSRGAVDDLGATLETVGWIVAGVGLGAVALGLIWHFLEPTGPKKETSAALVPIVGPNYAGWSFSAKF